MHHSRESWKTRGNASAVTPLVDLTFLRQTRRPQIYLLCESHGGEEKDAAAGSYSVSAAANAIRAEQQPEGPAAAVRRSIVKAVLTDK